MTDTQAGFRRHRPLAANEILADEAASFQIPILASALAARRCIADVERVAIRRGAFGNDQKRVTPAIVGGMTHGAAHIGPRKPVPALAKRECARIFGPELRTVDRDARRAGLDILVSAHIDTHFMPCRRLRLSVGPRRNQCENKYELKSSRANFRTSSHFPNLQK